MWKLTVEREYTSKGLTDYTSTDRVYFEADDIEDLKILVEYFDDLGTEGKYRYKIERVEEKEGEIDESLRN